ncbi:MAG: hypothetical protein IPJ65_25220 [Archangiaceae bacterium]|nr:hypothetical protein [Archangiaceae bacterium]
MRLPAAGERDALVAAENDGISGRALELKVWRETLERPPDLTPHLRAAVGHLPLHQLEEQVRQTMVGEALGATQGSRSGAAKLLRISRQLLQHILKR